MIRDTSTRFTLQQNSTLMYHSVSQAAVDPWGIVVSPDNFERQIRFLTDNFNIITVSELIQQMSNGNVKPNSVCITFDDGYQDNYINAKPILETYNCPATFFIATSFLQDTSAFWWDELALILLCSKKLPPILSLEIDGKLNHYSVLERELTTEQVRQNGSWKWYENAHSSRCSIYLSLWNTLRTLHFDTIAQLMEIIRNWSAFEKQQYELPLALSGQQLRNLAANELFTIGLHTHSHPDLKGKAMDFQRKEIAACYQILQDEYGIQSNIFSYPYGNFDVCTLEVLDSLQMEACFTTEARPTFSGDDRMKLGRYQVFNSDKLNFQQ